LRCSVEVLIWDLDGLIVVIEVGIIVNGKTDCSVQLGAVVLGCGGFVVELY
jgi:hypothetical protein